MPDRPFFFESVQCAKSLLIRHHRIRPVHDQKINMICSEILKRFVTLSEDQIRLARAYVLPVNKGVRALCRDQDLLPPAMAKIIQRLTNIALRLTCIVSGRRIDEIDAALNRSSDRVQPRLI